MTKVAPTGPHGRIIERDINAALDAGFVANVAAVEAFLAGNPVVTEEAAEEAKLAEEAKIAEKERKEREKQEEKERKEKEKKRKNSFLGKVTSSAVNTIGREVGRRLVRGVLDTLLK